MDKKLPTFTIKVISLQDQVFVKNLMEICRDKKLFFNDERFYERFYERFLSLPDALLGKQFYFNDWGHFTGLEWDWIDDSKIKGYLLTRENLKEIFNYLGISEPDLSIELAKIKSKIGLI